MTPSDPLGKMIHLRSLAVTCGHLRPLEWLQLTVVLDKNCTSCVFNGMVCLKQLNPLKVGVGLLVVCLISISCWVKCVGVLLRIISVC